MQLPAYRIAEILGVPPTGNPDSTIISHLLTDSRDLTYTDGTLFFALNTDVNDGHNYISDLYGRGVRYFVIDRDVDTEKMSEATFWRVDNTLDALQALASAVREMLSGVRVIGITGSQGKTVMKEMLYLALSKRFKVTRSPRSYNSQIGVPLSIWEITSDTEIAIIEAGISQPGEMQRLQKMIKPDIGVFTSLTDEHKEGFESQEQKAHEKMLLMQGADTVYYNGDQENADVIYDAARTLTASPNLHQLSGDNHQLVTEILTDYLAYGESQKHEIEQVVDAISDKISSRIVVTETLKNCVVVYDGFTNDLRSVHDALNYTRRHLTPGRHLTMVLTEWNVAMDTESLSALLKAKGVERLIFVGKDYASINIDGVNTEHAEDLSDFLSRYSISDFSDEVILVKGGNGSQAEEIKSLLDVPGHETVMEVDLGAVTKNFNFFRSHLRPQTGVVCMVKAAGYGVGAVELAKTLQNQGAAYLAVAVVDEGVELRHAGITMPIIVMNPMSTNYKALFDHRLEPSVFSIRELRLLLDNAKRLDVHDYPIHIKLDTGMHRLGFLESEIPELVSILSQQSYVKVASIFSHLATADCLDQDEYTQSQLYAFEAMSTSLMHALPYKVKRHILNTAGILRYPQYQYDMVRLGIGLYGVAPIDGYKLDTVATLLSTIISIKHWDKGTTIGYGRHGVIEKPTTVATVAIGYADGLNRHLSNHAAYMMVKGHKCDIIGNICMDQCMIDITGVEAQIGDSVEIFGKNAPITRLSDTLGTIPYEILTSISPRAKRVYFRD